MNAKAKIEIEEIKKKVVPILRKYGIERAGVFGSVTRGLIKKDSDIDILVDMPRKLHITLLDFAHIHIELEDRLNRKVDLVEYCTVRPEIKENIFSEEVRIL